MLSEFVASLQRQDTDAIRAWASNVAEAAPDYPAFQQELSRHGRVLPRHGGDRGEHLWFAPGNSAKWIRLEEYGPSYFAMPTARKAASCSMSM